jgi:L-2,4-diaminobutyrate decarboxylase
MIDGKNNFAKNEILSHKVWSALQEYRLDSENRQSTALLQQKAQFLADEMGLENWIRERGLNLENLAKFLDPYLRHSNHLHHPGFIGHQVAVPHIGASIAGAKFCLRASTLS